MRPVHNVTAAAGVTQSANSAQPTGLHSSDAGDLGSQHPHGPRSRRKATEMRATPISGEDPGALGRQQ